MRVFWVVLYIFVYFFSNQALAEKTTIIADADIMEKNSRTQTLSLSGNVNVIFHQQHLLCDEAVVHEDKGLIIAKGNVSLQNGRTTLRGDQIEFNYNTNTGKLFNGVITSGQILIQADIIEKVGEDEYVADDAYYTACLTCPPSWGFTSTRVTAEMGGYAYINRPWLYLLEVPVLPLPYLVVPLNSKRRTGLLVPRPSSNPEGGFAIEQPFYWAIDRSSDATFSLINYDKRGLQGFVNYRYVLSETSSGELNTSYLKDDRVKKEKADWQNISDRDRWFIQYAHRYDLPNDYVQRVEVALASDREYAKDFVNQFRYDGYPALQNNLSLTKSFENSLLTMEANYNITLIEQSPRLDFDNAEGLHRMPEINYQLKDQKLSEDYNILFGLDVQYLNIASQGIAFQNGRSNTECVPTNGGNADTSVCYANPGAPSFEGGFVYGSPYGTNPESDSRYGDLIRTGQRLDVMPKIHAPFWVGDVLDVDPSLALRYTQYALGVESGANLDTQNDYDSFPSRFYSQIGLNTKSYFSRVFQWSETRKMKHSIIPEVDIRYIPKIHQTDHNFFGTQENLKYLREQQPIDDTDADWRAGGRGIQFDNRDRVIGKQIVTFGLTNKILSRQSVKTPGFSLLNGGYEQNLLFRVSQAFDINEARKGDDARPWQDIRTELGFSAGPVYQGLTTKYYPYHGKTEWWSTSRYSFYGTNFVELNYVKYYTINSEPPVDDNTKNENLIIGTGLTFKYINFYGNAHLNLKRDAAQRGQVFQQWMIKASIIPPGSCWSLNADVTQLLDRDGIINYGVSMEFQFGG